MSKVDYDLDSSGGLMHIIQALIKPPEDDPPRPAAKPKSYYKRPGRGHNHDTCDACDEGGDLICCDRCPSSFHLGCHDPPLDAQHIPAGIWLCHHCRMTKPPITLKKTLSTERRNSGRNSDTSTSSSSATTPPTCASPAAAAAASAAAALDVGEASCSTDSSSNSCGVAALAATRRMRQLSGTRANSVSSDSNTGASTPIDVEEATAATAADAEDTAVKSAFDELIRAASILNPKQFELPRELNVFVQFPGADKIEPCAKLCAKKASRANSKKKPHELDSQGHVPLPAKTCFYCRRSCKKAPLVACDYCPSYFHQDCLDPPLTALPTGLWMCPNHPEQFIDWKLVRSVSATERIKLWSRFAGPVDQDTIKAEFFRKVHSVNPPFRFKRRMATRERVQIPPMVVHHYRHPTSLLPTLRDVLRCETVFQRRGQPLLEDVGLGELIEADLRALRAAHAKLDGSGPEDDVADVLDEATVKSNEDDDVQVVRTAADDVDVVDITDTPMDVEPPPPPPPPLSDPTPTPAPANTAAAPTTTTSDEDLSLEHLDAATIKRLAFQRLQQICQQNPGLVDSYSRQTTGEAILDALQRPSPSTPAPPKRAHKPLPSQLLTRADIERIAREFTGTSAARRSATIDEETFETADKRMRVDDSVGGVALNGFDELRTETAKARELAARLAEPLRESKVRARAMLMPVDDILAGRRWFTKASMDGAVYMRYRQLTVGVGPGSDVQLRGDVCSCVSAKHAVIFYDDVTETFEMLNYSEFGTEVNGQLFSCDLTEHPLTPAPPLKRTAIRNPADDPKAFYANIRAIVDKRRGIQRQEAAARRQRTVCMEAPPLPPCECRTRPPLIQGWEGTAILGHGSLVRFGCVPYVFAIAER